MMLWLAAAVVWCAVGARIGRVLVRRATPVRVAIAVSVVTVALNTMLLMPDVAGTVDRIAGGDALRGQAVELLWAMFGAATLTISEAARPILPKNRLHCGAWFFYLVAGIATAIGFIVDEPFGWLVVVFAAAVGVVVGVRHIAWSVLGRGIAVYTAGVMGAALSALYVVVKGYEPAPGLLVLQDLLIALGSVLVLGEVWTRSLIALIRIRRLHKMLTERYPEVLTEDPGHKTVVLRSSDHVAQVMDAIYLQFGHLQQLGATATSHETPPRNVAKRAHHVVRWLIDPTLDPAVDAEWISPPAGLSTRRWVVSLATEFDRLVADSSVTA